MKSTFSRPTREEFAKKLEIACTHIRSIPHFASHPAQKINLLLACTPAGYRPIHCAAAMGNVELVSILAEIFSWLGLEAAALSVHDCHGYSALHWATVKARGPIIQILVERGASVNDVEEHGRTPLHLAISAIENCVNENELKFHRDLIRFLLVHGANPDVGDEEGTCPIHLASEVGDEEVLDLLVSHGASPHVRDDEGDTCVFYAIRGNHRHVIQKLVHEFNVDLTLRNEDGETALDYCNSVGESEDIVRLVEFLSQGKSQMMPVAFAKQLERQLGTSKNSVENSPKDFSPNLSLSTGTRFMWDQLMVSF